MRQRWLKWQRAVFSYVTSCDLIEIYLRFGEVYCLHLQEYLRQSVRGSSTVRLEGPFFFFFQWNQFRIIRYSPRKARIDLRDSLLVFCCLRSRWYYSGLCLPLPLKKKKRWKIAPHKTTQWSDFCCVCLHQSQRTWTASEDWMITHNIWKGFGRKRSWVNLVRHLHVHKNEMKCVHIQWSERTQACKSNQCLSVAYRGGVGVFKPPPTRHSEGLPKSCQTQPDLWKLLKIVEFRMPTP